MSRAPVAGQTKTRLIPTLGAEGARDFHVACLNDLMHTIRYWKERSEEEGMTLYPHLTITPSDSKPAFLDAGVAWPKDFFVHNQQGESLGERMASDMERALDTIIPSTGERIGGALLLGSDLPLLRRRHLDMAARALETADVVLGPTMDGGYYLIGMKRFHPELFAIDGWGGMSILDQSLEVARKAGLTTALAPRLPDADTGEDLRVILGHAAQDELNRSDALKFVRKHLS